MTIVGKFLKAVKATWYASSDEYDMGYMWGAKTFFSGLLLFVVLVGAGLMGGISRLHKFHFGEFASLYLVFSAIYCACNFGQMTYATEGRNKFLVAIVTLVSMGMGVIALGLTGRFIDFGDMANDVKNLQNLNDPQVDNYKVSLLAQFEVCCIDDDDEVPDLSCNETDIQQPCFFNEEEFENKKSNIGRNSVECRECKGNTGTFNNNNRLLRRSGSSRTSGGRGNKVNYCLEGPDGFVEDISKTTKNTIFSITYLIIIFIVLLLLLDTSYILFLIIDDGKPLPEEENKLESSDQYKEEEF